MRNVLSAAQYAALFEKELPQLVPECDCEQADVREMLLYSLASGGKRVRPVLCLAFCALCGGDAINAVPFAAAVEFIHTYSLIHDDLPCMDNDDIRRGKPSSHIRFGEANALLAGDALLTHAFSLLASAAQRGLVDPTAAVSAVLILSNCAGVNGMIGGQYTDLATEGQQIDIDTLRKMDLYKTGALIKAACQLGCIAAGADNDSVVKAGEFADYLGLAFQIIDDLLDEEDEYSSDKANDKATYPGILGSECARALADEYTELAVRSLRCFGESAEPLVQFAQQLLSRKV